MTSSSTTISCVASLVPSCCSIVENGSNREFDGVKEYEGKDLLATRVIIEVEEADDLLRKRSSSVSPSISS